MCFTIFSFLTSTAPALAQGIPLSPAGGGYLALDGRDDYASLDFEKYGALFKEGTNTLTVEAWVYPTSVPVVDKQATILAQQIVLYMVDVDSPWFRIDDPELKRADSLLVVRFYGVTKGPGRGYILIVAPLSLHKWNHVVFQAEDNKITLICDDYSRSYSARTVVEHNVIKLQFELPDFVLGGYGREREPANPQVNL